jgi:hypothetical protein
MNGRYLNNVNIPEIKKIEMGYVPSFDLLSYIGYLEN